MKRKRPEPRQPGGTPNLPVTFAQAEIEAEALAYTRASVRKVRDEEIEFFGLKVFWFDKLDNRRSAREMLKQWAAPPFGCQDLVNLARANWDLAHEAALELITEYKFRREPLPPPLAGYDYEVTDPRGTDYER